MKIKNNDFELNFIERINIPLFFMYVIEIKNLSKKKIKIDLSKLNCNAGINALNLGLSEVNEIILTKEAEIEEGKMGFCYIAFKKSSNILTNQPTFEFEGIKIKVKNKEVDK